MDNLDTLKKNLFRYDVLHDFQGGRCNKTVRELVGRLYGDGISLTDGENEFMRKVNAINGLNDSFEGLERSAFLAMMNKSKIVYTHDTGPMSDVLYKDSVKAVRHHLNTNAKNKQQLPAYGVNLVSLASVWDEAGKPSIGRINAVFVPQDLTTDSTFIAMKYSNQPEINFKYTNVHNKHVNYVEIRNNNKSLKLDFDLLANEATKFGVKNICKAIAIYDKEKSAAAISNILTPRQLKFLTSISFSTSQLLFNGMSLFVEGLDKSQFADVFFTVKHSMDNGMARVSEFMQQLPNHKQQWSVYASHYMQDKSLIPFKDIADITGLIKDSNISLLSIDRLCYAGAKLLGIQKSILPRTTRTVTMHETKHIDEENIRDHLKGYFPADEAVYQFKLSSYIQPNADKYEAKEWNDLVENLPRRGYFDEDIQRFKSACNSVCYEFHIMLLRIQTFIDVLSAYSHKILLKPPDFQSMTSKALMNLKDKYYSLAAFYKHIRILGSKDGDRAIASWTRVLADRLDNELINVNELINMFIEYRQQLKISVNQLADKAAIDAILNQSLKEVEDNEEFVQYDDVIQHTGPVSETKLALWIEAYQSKYIKGSERSTKQFRDDVTTMMNESVTPELTWIQKQKVLKFFEVSFKLLKIAPHFNLSALLKKRQRLEKEIEEIASNTGQTILEVTPLIKVSRAKLEMPQLRVPPQALLIGEVFNINLEKYDNIFDKVFKSQLAGHISGTMSTSISTLFTRMSAIITSTRDSRTPDKDKLLVKGIVTDLTSVLNYVASDLQKTQSSLDMSFINFEHMLTLNQEMHPAASKDFANYALDNFPHSQVPTLDTPKIWSDMFKKMMQNTKNYLKSVVDNLTPDISIDLWKPRGQRGGGFSPDVKALLTITDQYDGIHDEYISVDNETSVEYDDFHDVYYLDYPDEQYAKYLDVFQYEAFASYIGENSIPIKKIKGTDIYTCQTHMMGWYTCQVDDFNSNTLVENRYCQNICEQNHEDCQNRKRLTCEIEYNSKDCKKARINPKIIHNDDVCNDDGDDDNVDRNNRVGLIARNNGDNPNQLGGKCQSFLKSSKRVNSSNQKLAKHLAKKLQVNMLAKLSDSDRLQKKQSNVIKSVLTKLQEAQI